MTNLVGSQHSNRKALFSFSFGLIAIAARLILVALLRPKNWEEISSTFSELYSNLWDRAEHSISHDDFTLPTALGNDSVHTINRLLLKLYGGKFSSLSMGGSSGALVTLLTAVLPKLHRNRDLILYDDVCHQSAIGGIIFGRWKAARLPRSLDPVHNTVRPLTFDVIKENIEAYGPERIAALLLVSPSYDGFSSPSEIKKIYTLAKSFGITVIIDGAWDSMRFRSQTSVPLRLETICDIWITSPHKRGLTPSSLGCMITQSETVAALWDEAQDLGFRSSSPSFVNIMIAEHRLQKIVNGDWDAAFSKAEQSAKLLRKQIGNIHPDLAVVECKDVDAETADPAHILICTRQIQGFDSRKWAAVLSSQFGLDVEKATTSTLLLICASPEHFDQIDEIMRVLKKAFDMTPSKIGNHDER